MVFISTEFFDHEALKQIINNWTSIVEKYNIETKYDPFKILTKYYETADKTDAIASIPVEYDYSPFHQDDQQGRLFVKYGMGLQSFKKCIRNTLTHTLYNDYDIQNCHPTILSQYCHLNHIECSYLDEYVNHRETIISDIQRDCKLSHDKIKKDILATLNGGIRYINNDWFNHFKNEIVNIHQQISQLYENQPILTKLQQEPNINGRLTNHRLCIIENNILSKIIQFLNMMCIDTSNIVLEFDGFELPKSYNLTEFFLQQLSDYVFKENGYRVCIIRKIKDNSTIIDFTKTKLKVGLKNHDDDKHIDYDYVKVMNKTITIKKSKGKDKGKDEVEIVIDEERVVEYLNRFLLIVNSNKSFIIEINDLYIKGYIFYTNSNLAVNRFAPIHDYFCKWLFSNKRREISNIVYQPYLKNPPITETHNFNLFRGFKHLKKQPFNENFIIDMNLINPWLDMIKHNWCNDDETLYQFVIKWFAHKIQFPTIKLITTIVITSILEGIGKNTFFDFFNHNVIGSEFGFCVGSIDELICEYNDKFETSLIVCCDELKNTGNQFKFVDALKKIVSQTTQNIHAKFMSIRPNCPDYNDYIFFTNNWGVIKPSMSDRRYFCMEGNIDRANNHEYWSGMYQLKNDRVGEHFFYYLATLSLEDYNPRDIPMTSWKRELKEMSIDPIVRSIINYIIEYKNETEPRLHPINDLYEHYELITHGKFMTNTRGYSVKCNKLLGLETIRKSYNGKQQRGYYVSIPYLMDRIQNILKDNEYPFENIDSDFSDDE